MARPSGQLSMAVLVLLAAAAGTRVVAADLGAVAGDRGVGGGVGLGEAGLFGFLVGAEATGVGVLELHLARGGFGLGALLRFERGDLFLAADAHARQQRDDLALDLRQHVAEQFERLALVLLLGLLLRVRSEEHTSELQSLMRISYAVFCLQKKKPHTSLHKHN